MADKLNTGVIVFLWIVLAFVAGISGDFNIGDDFSYAKAVENLYLNGEIRFTDWTSMTLIFQVIIGYLFSLLFGFSFETLRLVSLSSAILGSLGIYFTSREFTDEKKSFIITFFSVFHPAFALSSIHFSTDINFFCFFIWSVYFSLRFVNTNNNKYYILFMVFLIMSFFIREVSGIYAAAFLAYFISKKNYSIKAFLPLVLLSLAYLSYKYWLENYHGTPTLMDLGSERLADMLSRPSHVILVFIKNILLSIFYIGIILIPFVIQKVNKIKKMSLIIILISSILISTMIYFSRLSNDFYSFVFQHINHHFPIGDIYNWDLSGVYLTNKIVFFFYLFLSFSSFGILALTSRIDLRKSSLINIFFIIYLLFISIQYIYPRYLFPIIFIVLIKYSRELEFNKKLILYLLMIFSFYYSISTAADRLNYHRAQNVVQEKAYSRGIQPNEIDAGFEFGAYHFYNNNYQKSDDMNWWWVQEDNYLIRPGIIEKAELLDSSSYIRMFPPFYKEKIYLIKNRKD